MVAGEQPPPSDLPRGIVPLIEYQQTHLDFLTVVRPARALVPINHIERMIAAGETADSLFPRSTTSITTTTISDRSLGLTSWKTELERLLKFQPDYHIPADTAVYDSYSHLEKADQVLDHLRGYTKLAELITERRKAFVGDPPTLIPLIKSTEEGSLYHTFDIMEAQGATMAAFYVTQYQTGEGGNPHSIIDAVQSIFDVAPDWFQLLLLGCLGDHILDLLPGGVVAASGLYQWRNRIKPQAQSPETMQTEFESLGKAVHQALDVSAPILHQPIQVSVEDMTSSAP